jgi:hypothetical protein
MPENIPTKSYREKIEDAIAEKSDLLQPGDSVQTVSDTMATLDANILPGREVPLAGASRTS